jgi:hypothetical protein
MEGALKIGNQMEKQRLDFWRRAGRGGHMCHMFGPELQNPGCSYRAEHFRNLIVEYSE